MAVTKHRLKPGIRYLEFDFHALSFIEPERSDYRYRLLGYDQGWLDSGGGTRASYTSLPVGDYTFEVQALVTGTEWGETASWAFVVPPFFWQSLRFRAALFFGFAGLLIAAYRYRVGKLLEMERLRLRIASDLHDDLGANMSSIALLSQMLRDRKELDPRARRQLDRIRAAAEETMVGLRDVIWLVDPRHDTLTELTRRMRAVAADLLVGKEWNFRQPNRVPTRRLDSTMMRHAFLAYKEVLTNVVRHSKAKHIDIDVSVDGTELVVTVIDDGVGFDPGARAAPSEPCNGGNGLANLRNRATEVDGRTEIQSAPGEGTRVTFSVKMW